MAEAIKIETVRHLSLLLICCALDHILHSSKDIDCFFRVDEFNLLIELGRIGIGLFLQHLVRSLVVVSQNHALLGYLATRQTLFTQIVFDMWRLHHPNLQFVFTLTSYFHRNILVCRWALLHDGDFEVHESWFDILNNLNILALFILSYWFHLLHLKNWIITLLAHFHFSLRDCNILQVVARTINYFCFRFTINRFQLENFYGPDDVVLLVFLIFLDFKICRLIESIGLLLHFQIKH